MHSICVISPSLKMGGIERALVTISNEFSRKGNKIDFLICLKGNEFYQLDNEVCLHKPNFERDDGLINKLFFYPRLIMYIRRKINEINPTFVLVYGDIFSPIVLLSLIFTNRKIFISDRTIPNYKFHWPILLLKRWLYPKSAGFIAQTEKSAEFKRKKFGNRLNIKVIPNALPELDYRTSSNLIKEKSILYVGRFAWEKDPEILVRSFEIISNKFPDWKLIMAGSGPLLSKIKSLTYELGISNRVEFPGNFRKVEELYSKSTIYVLPSIVEGFPNSLIEAMAFGLPCVCFSDIPHEHIITNEKNGIIVNSRSAELLSEKIILLIKNEEIRFKLGLQAKKDVVKFSSIKIANEIMKFMEMRK